MMLIKIIMELFDERVGDWFIWEQVDNWYQLWWWHEIMINRQPYCLKMRIYKDIWCALICGDVSNIYKDEIERKWSWGINE